MASVNVLADEEAAVAGLEPGKRNAKDTNRLWEEGIELGDKEIRKTVRIQQSY